MATRKKEKRDIQIAKQLLECSTIIPSIKQDDDTYHKPHIPTNGKLLKEKKVSQCYISSQSSWEKSGKKLLKIIEERDK